MTSTETTAPATVTVHFATRNGRVVDQGVSSENYDRRRVQMYVTRNNKAAQRYTETATYAVVSYTIDARPTA